MLVTLKVSNHRVNKWIFSHKELVFAVKKGRGHRLRQIKGRGPQKNFPRPPRFSSAPLNKIPGSAPAFLAFSFERNNTMQCFNCSANNYSFEESICALHSIPSVKKKMKTCTRSLILKMWHDFIIYITF